MSNRSRCGRSVFAPLAVATLVIAMLPSAIALPGADALAASHPTGRTVTVYYFHRTIRCAGCLAIERTARAAIARSFRRSLRLGTVVWRPANLDDPAWAPFEKRYRLTVQTLVLSERIDGRERRWKRLDAAWSFGDDSLALAAYVTRSLREFQAGSSSSR